MKVCKKCGQQIADNESFCSVCGTPSGESQNVNCTYQQNAYTNNSYNQYKQNNPKTPPVGYVQKSRLLAGLLGIFLGGYGVHNFYLGFTTKAVIQIIITVVTCGIGAIWGFVEGILILCRHINEDAYGVPLKQDC